MNKVLHWFRRWHHVLGVLAAIPVLLLAVTGILLNHLDSIDNRYQPIPLWLASFYGAEPVETVEAVEVGEKWFVRVRNQLFLDGEALASCDELQGAIQLDQGWLAACDSRLIRMSEAGALLEVLDDSWGVPEFKFLAGVDGQAVLVMKDQQAFLFDINQMLLQEQVSSWQLISVQQVALSQWPQLVRFGLPEELHWQRFLQDIHSGRLFSQAGVWVMDIAALAMIFLALSGVSLWWQRGSRRRRQRRKRRN